MEFVTGKNARNPENNLSRFFPPRNPCGVTEIRTRDPRMGASDKPLVPQRHPFTKYSIIKLDILSFSMLIVSRSYTIRLAWAARQVT